MLTRQRWGAISTSGKATARSRSGTGLQSGPAKELCWPLALRARLISRSVRRRASQNRAFAALYARWTMLTRFLSSIDGRAKRCWFF